jgi:hypothetical protein
MVRIAGAASSNVTCIRVNAIGSGLDKKHMRVRVQEN